MMIQPELFSAMPHRAKMKPNMVSLPASREEPAIPVAIADMASSVRAAPISFIRIQAVGPPNTAIRAINTITGANAGPIAVKTAERRPVMHSSLGIPNFSAFLKHSRRNISAIRNRLMIMKLDITQSIGEFIMSFNSI